MSQGPDFGHAWANHIPGQGIPGDPTKRPDKPNLIERLENLIHSLEEARTEANDNWPASVLSINIENAYGIAGEILTMIDGR